MQSYLLLTAAMTKNNHSAYKIFCTVKALQTIVSSMSKVSE